MSGFDSRGSRRALAVAAAALLLARCTNDEPPETKVPPPSSETEPRPPESERPACQDPGRVTPHRLNRAEYDNTVRDLLDVLSLGPLLMEKDSAAAQKGVGARLPRLPPRQRSGA